MRERWMADHECRFSQHPLNAREWTSSSKQYSVSLMCTVSFLKSEFPLFSINVHGYFNIKYFRMFIVKWVWTYPNLGNIGTPWSPMTFTLSGTRRNLGLASLRGKYSLGGLGWRGKGRDCPVELPVGWVFPVLSLFTHVRVFKAVLFTFMYSLSNSSWSGGWLC